MKIITEEMRFRKKLCEFVLKNGVTQAARRYHTNRQFIYRQLEKYDGTLKILALKSRKPHSHPNTHTVEELDYKKNGFDVSFSNGVLEHFTNEQIIDTLKQQMKIAKIVIFGIPTKYFNQEEAMYGDERYMSYKFWRNLINDAGGIVLEEKSMHYMNKRKRLLNFKKYFRPYPYRIFVIKLNK